MSLLPPTRGDVERQFGRLLRGEVGRDEIDRWAGRHLTEGVRIDDEAVVVALGRLFGVDLVDGPDGRYLHDLSQVAEWLAEFRAS